MKVFIRIYKSDGHLTEKNINFNNDIDLLKKLQNIVGGPIECVPTYKNHYCNENGKLINLPLNPHFLGYGIVGDVVEVVMSDTKYGITIDGKLIAIFCTAEYRDMCKKVFYDLYDEARIEMIEI